MKHYLQHVFGSSYEVNYYTGDWMMGPNLFCSSRQPACFLSYAVNNLLKYFKPKSISDIDKIKGHLADLSRTLNQYIENMRLGVRAGMIRATEDCVAGLNSFSRTYMQVNLNGPEGKQERKQ